MMTPECEAILARIREANLARFFDVKVDTVHFKGASCGETPLHILAKWGESDSIAILLDNGAEIDAIGEDGCTPLHQAISQEKQEAVKLLVERGASLAIRNDFGQNAMDLANLRRKEEDRVLFRSILENR